MAPLGLLVATQADATSSAGVRDTGRGRFPLQIRLLDRRVRIGEVAVGGGCPLATGDRATLCYAEHPTESSTAQRGCPHAGVGETGREFQFCSKSLVGAVCCQCSYRRVGETSGKQIETADLTEDPVAFAHAQSLGYSSAPVVITDDDHWTDYRPSKIDALAAQ
jgi:glutaredoxin-like protein NrdH